MTMSISSRDILLLQTLKGFGNVAVRVVATEMLRCDVSDDKGLYELMSRFRE